MTIYAERVMRAVAWCQANKVAIDCTDGLWQIETWPDNSTNTRLTSKSHEAFLDAVEDLKAQLAVHMGPIPLRVQSAGEEKKSDG